MSVWIEVVEIVVLIALGGWAITFRKYAGKKGENLATMEDIGPITREVETVKADVANHSSRLQWVQRAQFDIEFQNLQKVWEAASNARRNGRVGATSLPSHSEFLEPRQEALWEAVKQLRQVVDDTAPFYSRLIYDALGELITLCDLEAHRCLQRSPGRQDHDAEWFERRDQAYIEIVKKADEISNLIRERLAEIGGSE